MSVNKQDIPKTLDERLEELSNSISLINHCLEKFGNTKKDYFLTGVITQLRALLTFNTKRSGGNSHALLIDLAQQSNIDLEIYSFPPKQLDPNVVSSTIASKTWSPVPVNGFNKYSLKDWMLVDVYHEDREHVLVNRNDLVRALGDKQASHYDPGIRKISDSLRRDVGSNLNGIQLAILDIGFAALYSGQRFFRTLELNKTGADPSTDPKLVELVEHAKSLHLSLI